MFTNASNGLGLCQTWFVRHVPTARERARAGLISDIKDEARRQLVEAGPSGLVVRAIARELGMAPSALYRYFASREELLTALIIDAYDALGEVAEAADAACAPDDYFGRLRAIGRAVRSWALDHPHEYALIYGFPVSGYRAPPDTFGPALRVGLVLAGVLRDGVVCGVIDPRGSDPPISPGLLLDVQRAADLMPGVPPGVVLRGLVAWTQLFGAVSMEVFGHLEGVVEDRADFFEYGTEVMAGYIGLPAPAVIVG